MAKNLVKSFKAACKIRGLNPKRIVSAFSRYPAKHRAALVAQAELFLIIDVLNEGHQFDWNNYDERKWYLWWDMEKSASNPSGFRLYAVGCTVTGSHVGSRHCFKSKEIAEHAAKYFIKHFKAIMVVDPIGIQKNSQTLKAA